ncbi:transmembrane protein 245 isoform X2 [Orussus abietinus]|uniref:transmembrane protein 245 isoform X2 n=1 Tax=Orussus abietinus TaxID=222816 RepID=UPI000626E207|nr:transmembrane protein 245 isoform X2 [Orussus abietinus]
MSLPRTPMDNLMNMLSGLSAGHEKALRQGVYNAVALLLLFSISTASYGLYYILRPFVKPLIWALLCGSVLFPFKLSLADAAQSWFNESEASGKPLFVNALGIPLQIANKISEVLGSFLISHVKYIISIFGFAFVSLVVYNYTPNFLTYFVLRILMICDGILVFFISTCNIYMILVIVVGYLSVLYIYWTPANSRQFRYTSFVAWFMISLYLSNILGAYQIIIFCTLQTLYLIGFIYEVILIIERYELSENRITFMEAMQYALINEQPSIEPKLVDPLVTEKNAPLVKTSTPVTVDKNIEKEATEQSSPSDMKTVPRLDLTRKSITFDTDGSSLPSTSPIHGPKLSTSVQRIVKSMAQEKYFLRKLKTEFRMTLDVEENKSDTDKYMYGALYACGGMILWKHRWIMHIMIIPIAYYFLKRIGSYFDFWNIIEGHFQAILDKIKLWCKDRHQALLPANIMGLYKLYVIIDEKITQGLKASINSVATITVILGLLVFTICASVFITIQVYAEGIHIIQVTSEVVNSTLINNPNIDWIPEQWEQSVNSVLDNAYTYGRDAISAGVKSLMKDLESSKAEQMEKKVLELWDRLYQAWMMSNESENLIGPTVDMNAAFSAWDSLQESFGKPLQIFNMTSIQNFAKENVGILTSLLDSIWSIFKGNISVILTIVTELLYTVLLSGTALFNFTLSMVVFFTTLFYLLSSSGKTYKPVELITAFSPISCHRFAVTLQESVIGVFMATFKLASFFGMWTWFIHNLFQVKVVYLPSALATILGAVPFLDAYFACIPATLELWFVQGPMTAILFFTFHFLPCNIVVTEFYKEIKGGGHPYLTGLSIAGGIFCLGVEGAIFGPLLLCCIMVAINLSRRYLHSPSEETINTLKTQLGQLETKRHCVS